MHIWLVDYDGKIENLALMRLSAYHKAQGDSVCLKFGDAYPELFTLPDIVYISCLFCWNREKVLRLTNSWGSHAVLGGVGIDPKIELPPYVDGTVDYSLYGKDRAIGFISRGCIRSCPWCSVPQKEGSLKRMSTASEIVGDFRQVMFLDNNFLALPNCQEDLQWLATNRIAIDFNQGLDAKLVADEIAKLLADCKWTAGLRFACDSVGQLPAIDRTLNLLKKYGVNPASVFVYCLIGFSGIESDVERLLFLRKWNCNVFPMGYRELETGIQPAKGWDRHLYNKYRRLICRMPHANSIWEDFKSEVCRLTGGTSC